MVLSDLSVLAASSSESISAMFFLSMARTSARSPRSLSGIASASLTAHGSSKLAVRMEFKRGWASVLSSSLREGTLYCRHCQLCRGKLFRKLYHISRNVEVREPLDVCDSYFLWQTRVEKDREGHGPVHPLDHVVCGSLVEVEADSAFDCFLWPISMIPPSAPSVHCLP